MKVKEVAELAGISVRTLHHYDAIGLLSPTKSPHANYRIYSEDDLALLQQILFFKELGFPLNDIKKVMEQPFFNRIEALMLHRKMLLEKREKMDQMLETLDNTIKDAKGEIHMHNKDKFKGFDFSHNPYEEEARKRWGNEAVDTAHSAIHGMMTKEENDFEKTFNDIYKRLAAIRHEDPGSEIAQEGVNEWYQFLNKIGNYTPEAFKSLGQMYVEDERFTENIDQFGKGLAVFMRDAMEIYTHNYDME